MEPRLFEKQWEKLFQIWKHNSLLSRLPEEAWREALKEGRVLPLPGVSKPLFRIRQAFKGFLEGTVFSKDLFVPGFPRIPRIFRLTTGVPRYFSGFFYAEEKIEGYNIRLFKVEDEILAITRRGFVCPFATDRFPDFLPRLEEFFKSYPNLCVCAEVAGPENPFVSEWPPYIKEDVRFFVFDFMRLPSGELLPPEEKYQLFETYGFPHPEINGPFHPGELSPLKELLRRYEAEGREGVVLKPASGSSYVKYVTPISNLEDLRVVFSYLGEVPPEYVTHRLVKYLISQWELFGGLTEEDLARVGRKMLGNLSELLHKVDSGEPVMEIFRARFRTEKAFQALLAHFRHAQVRIEIRSVRWEDGYLKVEFAKIYPRATAFWKHKLEGFSVVD